MNALRIAAALALAFAGTTQATDIVVTPAPGGSFFVGNSGSNPRFFVLPDGGVGIDRNGYFAVLGSRILHFFGSSNTFLGQGAGNFSMQGGGNTIIGTSALEANDSGSRNTASGVSAMISNVTGSENTVVGVEALYRNTSGDQNVAIGAAALQANTADGNVAVGAYALFENGTGRFNTAVGLEALFSNTLANGNTALGHNSMHTNITGGDNVAVGHNALYGNAAGQWNVAIGAGALERATGNRNTAVGRGALSRTFGGTANIAIGEDAGSEVNGNLNILIGNTGRDAESNTLRIGNSLQTRAFIAGIRGRTTGGAAIPVVIDSEGQLGTVSSSASTKDDIADMGGATEDLMKLRPVTFHYKTDDDPAGRTLQYGLVAEEVEQVYPGLVARSPDGQVETVMYQFLPSMLLNEVQKQRRTIERLEAKLAAIEQRLASSREPQ